MDVHEYAVIAFYDGEKRLLLQDRRNIRKYGEEWGFFGGRIEPGETPEMALKRETKEELDYDLVSYSFFKRIETPRDYGMNVNHVFLSKFPGVEKFNQLEGSGMRLYAIAEARTLKMTDTSYKVLAALAEHFEKL